MFCNKCGSRLDGDAVTCRQCGAAADAAEYCGGFWGLVGEKNAPMAKKTNAKKPHSEVPAEKTAPRAEKSGRDTRLVAVLLVCLMVLQLLGTVLCYTRLIVNASETEKIGRSFDKLEKYSERLADQLDELQEENEALAQQNKALQKKMDELSEELLTLKNALLPENSETED